MTDAPLLPIAPEALHWQAAPPDCVEWVQWVDDCVVYHHPSGKTHFVNAAARRLLTEVLPRAHSIDEIVNLLSVETSAEEQAEIRDSTLDLLLRLEEQGLVQSS
jgi:PqqD family protein of HPr-rel-A system